MEAADAAKFLRGNWTCYELSDWQMPYSIKGCYTLLQFIKCLEGLSTHHSVQVAPVAYEHLLCATLSLTLLPNARQLHQLQKNKGKKKKLAATPGKSTAKGKGKPEAKGKGKPEAKGEGTPEAEGLESLPLSVINSSDRPVVFKVVLDWCSELLLVSRRLAGWLEKALSRCLGCEELSVVCNFRGDARHLLQLRCQQGTEGGDLKSAQALLEHEWLEALRDRGRLGGHVPPLGNVTRALGAMPHIFPAVTTLHVTAKNVPVPLMKQGKSALPVEKQQECQQKLSALRLSEVRLTLDSPSLLHLYYNAALETYTCNSAKRRFVCSSDEPIRSEHVRWPPPVGPAPSSGEEDAAAGEDAGSRKKRSKRPKTNLEGVVKMAPVYIEKLRSGGSFRPVLEYS